MEQMEQKNSAAKYAFFYMLSLVALIFTALSTGIIVFQIINKNIVDILDIYQGRYDSGAIKFAISALIIASPIYYLATAQINKNLFLGKLDKDSGVRKWLSYFILLVTTIVMLGFLTGVIYNFLEGELTTKFILKAVTAIVIAGSIFSYYFYDIKRENVVGAKDKIIKQYFYGSVVILVAALISAFVFVESPAETRRIKYDNNTLNQFNQIVSAVNRYHYENKKLPENLGVLTADNIYLNDEIVKDRATDKQFGYNIIDGTTFELCADFMTSNKDREDALYYDYYGMPWEHEAGYQCLKQRVAQENANEVKPVPVR